MRPGQALHVRCMRCRHVATVTDQVLMQFGLEPDAPIAAFIKRLRCSKCGSGSVMAQRPSFRPVDETQTRKRRA